MSDGLAIGADVGDIVGVVVGVGNVLGLGVGDGLGGDDWPGLGDALLATAGTERAPPAPLQPAMNNALTSAGAIRLRIALQRDARAVARVVERCWVRTVASHDEMAENDSITPGKQCPAYISNQASVPLSGEAGETLVTGGIR